MKISNILKFAGSVILVGVAALGAVTGGTEVLGIALLCAYSFALANSAILDHQRDKQIKREMEKREIERERAREREREREREGEKEEQPGLKTITGTGSVSIAYDLGDLEKTAAAAAATPTSTTLDGASAKALSSKERSAG